MIRLLAGLALLGCSASGAQVITLHTAFGHSERVSAVAFSPDEKLLVTGSDDKTLRLWDAATGLEVERLARHTAGITAVAFSPDGHWVLSGSRDKTAILWDISRGWGIARFTHEGAVTSVAFSPDGRFILTGSEDRTARLWDRSSWQLLQELKGHRGIVTSVGFCTGGCKGRATLFTASVDGTVRFWNIADGKEIRRVNGPVGAVKAAALAPDGKLLLVAIENRGAWLLDAMTGATIRALQNDTDLVEFVAFSSDGRSVVTVAHDKAAKVWDVGTGRPVRKYETSRGTGATEFAPKGPLMASATWDNGVAIWDIRNGHTVRTLEGVSNRVQSLSISSDSRFIATGNEAGFAAIWDLSRGAEVHRLDGHAGSVGSVNFSADQKSLVTGHMDGTVRLWDLNTAEQKQQFNAQPGAVTVAAFSEDGQDILTGTWGRKVQLWELSASSVIRNYTVPLVVGWLPTSAAISPDGQWVVTASGGMNANLWDYEHPDAPRPLTGHTDQISSAAFSWDSHQVLTGSIDNTARVWDVSTGRQLRSLGVPSGAMSVAFAPDNAHALTGDSQGLAQIWELATGEETHSLKGHEDWISTAAYSRNSRFIATGSYDGTTRVWSTTEGTPLVALTSHPAGGWTTVDLDGSGRFDTNNLEGGSSLYFIVDDQPLRPLPVEIFMRDYYEPRLAARLLDPEHTGFAPIRPLGELNRVQPRVRIKSVRRGAKPGEALVSVWVAGNTDPSQRNGKTHTEPFDLRLLRDGQLVGQWPEPAGGSAGPKDVEAWRRASCVRLRSGRNSVTHTFTVELPSSGPGKQVHFAAYAFNEDRVKSETDHYDDYHIPTDTPRRQPHAYVLTIGINDYHSPNEHNLDFAVKDAQVMAHALRDIADHQVVAITLATQVRTESQHLDQATKANIRAALGLLSGNPAAPAERQQLIDAGVDRQTVSQWGRATPDDAVIITYSGHGYTQNTGAFFLLPSGSWAGEVITTESLKKFISSDELSEWLRPVDAGELALIIDACHAAASVETPGFKPGPMGDRGLGQLAYDKGMRILAASQADDVALEAHALEEGLLTYALVESGLRPDAHGHLPASPAGNGHVSLLQWLEYGESETPRLYERVLSGEIRMVSKDSIADADFVSAQQSHAQIPALFDFQHLDEKIVINAR